MDGTDKLLDIANITGRGREVPTYALYGEPATREATDSLHCETIEARSRLHDFRIRPHRHERLTQILYLSGGEGEAVFDGVRATLQPPCLLLVPPLVVHGYAFSNTVEGLVLTLYQQRAEHILRDKPDVLEGLGSPRVVELHGQPEAARIVAFSLAAIAAEFAGHAPGRTAMMEALLAVVWLAAHRVQSAAASMPSRGFGHIVRFRQMIERDFAGRLPIEHYARRLGLTEVHLRRLCQEHLATTPLATLNARVTLEARRLLEFSALDVKEVAAATGFTDDVYFSRFFQRETGLTPTAFRARRRTTGAS